MPAKKKATQKTRTIVQRPPRKQKEIAGLERVVDIELSDAAEELHSIRTDRIALSQKEHEAAAWLVELMKKKNVDTYIDEDLELRATLRAGADKVSVRKLKVKDEAPALDADAAE